MRALLFAIAMMAALLGAQARAQNPPAVVTENPAGYAQGFADTMTLSGIRSLRETYVILYGPFGGTLPTNIESTLLVYERAIGSATAQISRVIEDITLGEATRTIYIYHYFGNNLWLFTRLDFYFMGDGRWALGSLAFADQWASIVSATTPSFRATPTRR